MAELSCPRGHPLRADGQPTAICDEGCHEPSGHDEAQLPGVSVTVADATLVLAPGEAVLIGREPGSRAAGALERYPNVSRRHLELVAGEGTVEVRPLTPEKNGTFLGDYRLPAGQSRTVQLPVTLRLAANCYLRIEASGE